jgi:hypothetical protein
MRNFFVPHATSPEDAEQVYSVFLRNSTRSPGHAGRLFSITFRVGRLRATAEVGKEMTNWPERSGKVLGIIKTPELVCVHTEFRGGLSGTPILVSRNEVREYVYFDDYPELLLQA